MAKFVMLEFSLCATFHETPTPKGDRPMKQLILGAALVGMGTVIGALSSDDTNSQYAQVMVSIRMLGLSF